MVKKEKTKKKKSVNPWLVHLKDYQKSHPKISYTECMIEAKKTYKK